MVMSRVQYPTPIPYLVHVQRHRVLELYRICDVGGYMNLVYYREDESLSRLTEYAKDFMRVMQRFNAHMLVLGSGLCNKTSIPNLLHTR